MELIVIPIVLLVTLITGWLKGRKHDPSFEFISDDDELVI